RDGRARPPRPDRRLRRVAHLQFGQVLRGLPDRRLRSPELRQLFPSVDHVLQAAERRHVVALEAALIERTEQAGEIEVALARPKVLLLAIAPAIGEPDLVAAFDVERGQET